MPFSNWRPIQWTKEAQAEPNGVSAIGRLFPHATVFTVYWAGITLGKLKLYTNTDQYWWFCGHDLTPCQTPPQPGSSSTSPGAHSRLCGSSRCSRRTWWRVNVNLKSWLDENTHEVKWGLSFGNTKKTRSSNKNTIYRRGCWSMLKTGVTSNQRWAAKISWTNAAKFSDHDHWTTLNDSMTEFSHHVMDVFDMSCLHLTLTTWCNPNLPGPVLRWSRLRLNKNMGDLNTFSSSWRASHANIAAMACGAIPGPQ